MKKHRLVPKFHGILNQLGNFNLYKNQTIFSNLHFQSQIKYLKVFREFSQKKTTF
jgi:hypothetical protein